MYRRASQDRQAPQISGVVSSAPSAPSPAPLRRRLSRYRVQVLVPLGPVLGPPRLSRAFNDGPGAHLSLGSSVGPRAVALPFQAGAVPRARARPDLEGDRRKQRKPFFRSAILLAQLVYAPPSRWGKGGLRISTKSPQSCEGWGWTKTLLCIRYSLRLCEGAPSTRTPRPAGRALPPRTSHRSSDTLTPPTGASTKSHFP